MADPDEIFLEGFDKYGTTSQYNSMGQTDRINILMGEWSTWGYSPTLYDALSGGGYSISCSGGGGGFVYRNLRNNYSRSIGGYTTEAALGTRCGVALGDTGTVQVTVGISSSGHVQVCREYWNVLGTSSTAVVDGSVHCIEWDVKIDNTAGWAKVWIDGVLEINVSGVDTQNSSNPSYNQFGWFKTSSGMGKLDHMYHWAYLSGTDSGETPCLDNPIIDTTFGVSDNTVQLSIGAEYFGQATGVSPGSASTLVGNRPTAMAYIAKVSGTLDALNILPNSTSAGTSVRMGLYSDNSGFPGTLIAETDVITGTTDETELRLPFSSPPSLVADTVYWVCFWTSNNLSCYYVNSDVSGTYWYNKSFSGSLDTNFSGSASGGGYQQWYVRGELSSVSGSHNFAQGIQDPFSYNLSYNYGSTAGHQDVYNFDNLNFTASAVHCVGVKAQLARSASGARTASLITVSSSTEDPGSYSDFSLSPTILTYGSYWLKNPNGDVSWTEATVNAAKHGVELG